MERRLSGGRAGGGGGRARRARRRPTLQPRPPPALHTALHPAQPAILPSVEREMAKEARFREYLRASRLAAGGSGGQRASARE